MFKPIRFLAITLAFAIMAAALTSPVFAGSAQDLARDSRAALQNLYAVDQSAKLLGGKARGILVFPSIFKAGFMLGGQIGEGTMFESGKVTGYYSSVAASYGFQAGAQKFGYALFLMNDRALSEIKNSSGFEVGVGPSIVVVDTGMGKSITTTTIDKDIYAFIFSQKGLMGGIGIQGSKLTKIDK